MPKTEAQLQILLAVNQGVATITLNRPDAMNAFSGDMREKLLDGLRAVGARDDVGCVVITGTGKAFCAGGDISSMVDLQDNNDISVIESRIAISGEIIRQIRDMPQPVLAAVNGAAAGAGMNLALACDIRLASSKAIFAESFVKIGLIPDWGGFHFLTQLVGTAKAMELMMTGERVDASEALRLGLVNKVIPAENFAAEVETYSTRLASGPRDALSGIKRGVYLGASASIAEILSYENETQGQLFLSKDAREGMRAFGEKRLPEFGQK